MIACGNSGYDIGRCFVEVNKTLEMPNGGVKRLIDFLLIQQKFLSDTFQRFFPIKYPSLQYVVFRNCEFRHYIQQKHFFFISLHTHNYQVPLSEYCYIF